MSTRRRGHERETAAGSPAPGSGDPIPGTKRRSYLAENISALDIRLTPGDLRAIEEAAPRGAPLGDRYPPHMMQTINH